MRIFKKNTKTFILWALFFSSLSITSIYFQRKTQVIQREKISIQKKILKELNLAETFLSDTIVQQICATNIDSIDKQAWDYLIEQTNKRQHIALIYQHNKLKYWTNNAIVLNEKELVSLPNFSFQKIRNAYYIIYKKSNKKNILLLLIPIKHAYSYENEYLKNKFEERLKIPDYISLNEKDASDKSSILDLKGNEIFTISISDSKLKSHHFYFEICCELLAFIFAMSALLLYLAQLAHRKAKGLAILALFAILLALKTVTLYFHLPKAIFQLPIFGPSLFASNFLFASFGELIFNVFLLSIFIQFLYSTIANHKIIKSGTFLFLLQIIIAALAVFYTFFIKTLVLDSSITFDFFNIENLNIYSLIGLTLIGIVSYQFYLLLYTAISIVDSSIFNLKLRKIIFTHAALMIVAYFYVTIVIIPLSITFVISFALLNSKFSDKQRFPLSYIILIISLFVLLTVSLLFYYSNQKETQNRELLISKLALANDPIAEYLLDDILINAAKDPYIINQMGKSQPNLGLISDRLKSNHFNGYFSKYNRNIQFFSLNNKYDRYQSLLMDSFISNACEATANQNLFYQTNNDGILNYYAKIKYHIQGSEILAIVSLTANYFREDNIYPELFLEGNLRVNKDFNPYSYAIYKNEKLISQKGDYPYFSTPKDFYIPSKEFVKNGYSHMVYRPNKESLIVVSKENYSLVKYFSFYIYVFLAYLFLFIIIYLVGIFIKTKTSLISWNAINHRMHLLFKTRIQLSLVIAVVISISIMGIVTYSYISNLNESQEQDKLSQKLHAIQNILNEQTNSARFILAVNNDQFNQDFQRVADLYQSDINLYDLNGKLLLSTRPKLIAAGLTANYMNPTAFLKLSIDGQSELYLKEQVGDLKYLSAYIPIRNSKSEIIAYLNLPYFANVDEYNQKIALFFSTIINSYVLIIFIFSAIAFFIAKSLTAPLNLIQKELAKIKLGEKMKSINWKSNDEIGTLIQAYNNMIIELEESANMLAKSERESAWKEMAKQVAHEIKNPLTPMKLGLQLLERSYKNNDEDFNTRFEIFTKSFIQQIDNLTNIANEFANYAQMPKTKLAEINIKTALLASLELFKNNTHAVIKIIDETSEKITVLGDHDNFISIFNNLLSNAIQATEQIEQAQISIHLSITKEKLLLKFEDNGAGIPLSIQPQIFEPSFTTKNSGMGLGLAIVKSNLAQIGADIWFESTANKGTTFYVLIPIIKQ